jgi:glycosyltransferase involved in cell wall biosynthesis
MRVLITSSAERDLWQFTSLLVGQLAEHHAASVLVVILGRQPPADGLALLHHRAHPDAAVEIERVDLSLDDEEHASEAALAEVGAVLRDLAKRWGAQVIHANHFSVATVGFESTPVLLAVHGDQCSKRAFVDRESPPLVEHRYVERIMESHAAASCVVAPSGFVADCLGRWFGYRGVVRIIPYPAALSADGEQSERKIDVITSGELWAPAANFVCFQAAAASAPDLSFAAIGPLVPPGIQRTKPIAHSILFTGEATETERNQMLANSRIYVSASMYDPTGAGTIQAAQAGCRLLLSESPFYRSIWGDRAAYFNSRDVETLKAGIRSLLQDIETQAAVGSPARRQAIELHSAQHVAAAYLATYQRLVLHHGPAA